MVILVSVSTHFRPRDSKRVQSHNLLRRPQFNTRG